MPIVVLSVRDAEQDKVAALDAGADDYVTKPFGMDELLARLRAALRRATPSEEAPIVETPDFSIDLAAKQVHRDGVEIRLTPTEWHLAEVLVRNPGKLVSQHQLLHEVWGPEYHDESAYLRVHMANLRRKLEPEPGRPRYFVTEPGMGYRFQGVTARHTPRGRSHAWRAAEGDVGAESERSGAPVRASCSPASERLRAGYPGRIRA